VAAWGASIEVLDAASAALIAPEIAGSKRLECARAALLRVHPAKFLRVRATILSLMFGALLLVAIALHFSNFLIYPIPGRGNVIAVAIPLGLAVLTGIIAGVVWIVAQLVRLPMWVLVKIAQGHRAKEIAFVTGFSLFLATRAFAFVLELRE
jgi:hypothetical protein